MHLFIDQVKLKVTAGNGGNGAVAFRREKYIANGGPAGGDGGNGGDVYFVADKGLATLLDFKYRSVFKADSGQNGGIKGMHGKCAKHLYIKVPLGTIVKDDATGKVIADLTEEGQTVLIAKGGRGGRGNARLIAWEGERTVTFTMEDALISPVSLAVLSGAGVLEGAGDNEMSQIKHATETAEVLTAKVGD